MGLFSRKRSNSDSYDALPEVLDRPPEAPAGLFNHFINDQKPVVLVTHINQLTWKSENRLKVMDAQTGEIILMPSFKWTKGTLPHEVCDAHGQALFRLKLKFWSRTHTFQGLSPSNEDEILFTVKNDSGWTLTRIVLSFKNAADGQETQISLEDHGGSGALLYKNKGVFQLASANGKPVIGYLTRKPPPFLEEGEASKEEAARKRIESSYVSVAPGVDGALLQVMCICVEEIRQLMRVNASNSAAAAASSAAAAAA